MTTWAETEEVRASCPGLLRTTITECGADTGGFGGMVGLTLAGGTAGSERFLRRLKLVTHAPSLAGVESLISEPRLTSHRHLTAEERATLGFPDGFVRLSCGIEDSDDLIADLDQALGTA